MEPVACNYYFVYNSCAATQVLRTPKPNALLLEHYKRFHIYLKYLTVAPRSNKLACIDSLHIMYKILHLCQKSSHSYCSVYGINEHQLLRTLGVNSVVFASQITD